MDILIAEDDFISRKLLVNILEELGHIVSVASDGEEAWQLYRKQPCRMVITDWLMPRMDGLQLVEKIRSEIPELPGPRLERFIKEYRLPAADAAILQ